MTPRTPHSEALRPTASARRRARSSTRGAIGDVCYFDEGQFVTAQGYYARNKNTGSGTAIVWGVFLDAASAGANARVCVGGVVSPQVTGLSLQSAGDAVAVDGATGRLKLAGVGDPIVGYFDIQGNVFLLYPGRLV